MSTLSESRIATLLEPYLGNKSVPDDLYGQLSVYLDLLLKWNARTNLTAIREPDAIVQRHFGESLFCARTLESRLTPGATVLDYGSGAGFPGLPLQLLLPPLQVTLAESQGKKASFLREVVRTLGLKTEVWAYRVEDMPAGTCFNAVVLRAVDDMGAALAGAKDRVRDGGLLVSLTTRIAEDGEQAAIPGTHNGYLHIVKR